MTDEQRTRNDIEAARRVKQKAFRKKRAKLLVRIAAIVAVIAVIASCLTVTAIKDVADFFKSSFSFGEYPLKLSGMSVESVKTMSGGYCLQSGNTVTVVNASGAVLQTVRTDYLETGVATDGNKLLVFSSGGRKAKLFNRTSLLFEYTTEQKIIDGSLFGGRVALLTAGDRYSAELHIFDTKARETLKWYCADGFPYMVRFADGGSTVCLAAMFIENGAFKTKLTLIDVAKGSELFSVVADSTVLSLKVTGRRITAVALSGAYKWNDNGELSGQYSFSEASPTNTVFASNGNVAIMLGYTGHPNLNRYVILNSSLELVVENDIGAAVKDMRLSRDRIYVLCETSVLCYSFKNKLIEEISCNPSASVLVMPRSGTLLAVMNGTVIKIK